MNLVTGGTGLVGSHLLCFLLREKQTVRAIKRDNSNLTPVKNVFASYEAASLFDKIEWVTADLLDVPALEDAFSGVTQVYHCAAFLSFSLSDYHRLIKVNIEGTANVVNLCITNQVKKLCHVSSVIALGEPLNNSPISEETHWNPEADNNGYAISKFGAEMEVWRGSQEGLNVIMVLPSVIIGEGHWDGMSGSLFKNIDKGIFKYPKGGTGFVDVQDVVKALFELMKSDVNNKSFVLSSANLTYQHLITQIATNIGAKVPKSEAKNWQLHIAAFFQKVAGVFTGAKPKLNKESIIPLQKISEYDGSKITKTIPFEYGIMHKTLKRVSEAYLKK